jgi:hypothetical protein
VVLLCATASIWAFRAAGVHHMLRQHAFKQRNDWAYVSLPSDRSPAAQRQAALIRQLRADAFAMQMSNPHLLPPWMDRWWGE